MLFGGDIANRKAVSAINESGVPTLIVHGTQDTAVPMEEFSIISHKEDITAQNTEYFLCDEPQQDGHTNLLFDTDGTANDELMDVVENFLTEHVK